MVCHGDRERQSQRESFRERVLERESQRVIERERERNVMVCHGVLKLWVVLKGLYSVRKLYS